ncbi:uncharacterized protein [Procambarus clarkii]|uniref:uncharacterized protein n=1 Tax=Procambarus clarkii TaxID=6728 RepID=UPI0037429542
MGESTSPLREHCQYISLSALWTLMVQLAAAISKYPLTSLIFVFCECWLLAVFCEGQGRLVDPPSRASMWRFGFKNPVEFGDDRVNCGGFRKQWKENQGQCGVCGDPWDLPRPRPHETRGRYARGIIVRSYTQGQEVELVTEVTAAGSGWVEYHVCPRTSVWALEDPTCFTHTLQDDAGRTKFPINMTQKLGRVSHRLILPATLSCSACVIQWRYVKLGRPERTDYRACADVTITPSISVPPEGVQSDASYGSTPRPLNDAPAASEKVFTASPTSLNTTTNSPKPELTTAPPVVVSPAPSKPVNITCPDLKVQSGRSCTSRAPGHDHPGGGGDAITSRGSTALLVSVMLLVII